MQSSQVVIKKTTTQHQKEMVNIVYLVSILMK